MRVDSPLTASLVWLEGVCRQAGRRGQMGPDESERHALKHDLFVFAASETAV